MSDDEIKMLKAVFNQHRKEVSNALADLFSAVIRIIHVINSFTPNDPANPQRIEYQIEKTVTDQLSKWNTRAIGVETRDRKEAL